NDRSHWPGVCSPPEAGATPTKGWRASDANAPVPIWRSRQRVDALGDVALFCVAALSLTALFVAPATVQWSARVGAIWRLGKTAEVCLSTACVGPGARAQTTDCCRFACWGGVVESIPEQGLPVRADVHRLRTGRPLFRLAFGRGYERPHGAGLRAPHAVVH